MPACPSSPIDLLAARAGAPSDRVTDPDASREVDAQAATDLVAELAKVPDPRSRRGVRHRLVTVLALAVCAVLAGARSYVAIAEWAHDLPLGVRLRLGLTVRRATPSESAIRRLLQRVETEALDRVVSDWLVARAAPTSPRPPDPPGNTEPGDSTPGGRAGAGPARIAAPPPPVPSPRIPSPRVIAVDGKSARGARHGDERAVHLLAALDTSSGIVLGQSVVDGKSNEITAFTPLLDRVDITGAVITADALHTQDEHARYLHRRGAHYVFVVKGNRPKLHQQLAGLPWSDVPTVEATQDAGHGRRESRTLKLTALSNAATGGLLFPHAQLAVQIVRAAADPPPAAAGTVRPSTPSPTCPGSRSGPTNSPRPSASTGTWRIACTGSAMSPSPRTCPRSAPGTARRIWPPCATSPCPATASPAPTTSQPPAATSADTPTGFCRCSHNGQINYAGALSRGRTTSSRCKLPRTVVEVQEPALGARGWSEAGRELGCNATQRHLGVSVRDLARFRRCCRWNRRSDDTTGASLPLVVLRLVALGFLGLLYRWAAR